MNLSKDKKLKTIDLAYIGIFASIIAVCSWIAIPFGAIPVTLQTFAVCSASYLLGTKRGVFTILIYILLGAIGVPVFASFNSGVGYLLGPTGGFIIGFIFTSLIVGLVTEKFGKKPIFAFLSMVLGIIACYIFGSLWYLFVFNNANSNGISLAGVLSVCVVPFIIPDIIKITLSVLVCTKLKRYIK